MFQNFKQDSEAEEWFLFSRLVKVAVAPLEGRKQSWPMQSRITCLLSQALLVFLPACQLSKSIVRLESLSICRAATLVACLCEIGFSIFSGKWVGKIYLPKGKFDAVR
jgi:hypothetical protein